MFTETLVEASERHTHIRIQLKSEALDPILLENSSYIHNQTA